MLKVARLLGAFVVIVVVVVAHKIFRAAFSSRNIAKVSHVRDFPFDPDFVEPVHSKNCHLILGDTFLCYSLKRIPPKLKGTHRNTREKELWLQGAVSRNPENPKRELSSERISPLE